MGNIWEKLMKRYGAVIAALVVIMIVFFLLQRGHFFIYRSSGGNDRPDKSSSTQTETVKSGNEKQGEGTVPASVASPVKYRHMQLSVDGHPEEINILEVDTAEGRASIKPLLSYDRVFGFETMSDILDRNGANAGINAGFFSEYGQPAGMVVKDGRIITGTTGRYPVYLLEGGKPSLKEIEMQMWVESNGVRLPVNGINRDGSPGEVIAYTADYGSDNRAKGINFSVVTDNDTVISAGMINDAVKIPTGGMVITLFSENGENALIRQFTPGTKAVMRSSLEPNDSRQAYECGSWLVKDGEAVAGSWDEWVGTLDNHDPRTAIGITEDGKTLLVTVDGRQPGYSDGLTAKELAGLLLNLGVKDAAMLDGGASTEMILNGKMINRLSGSSQERPLGGALGVYIAP